MRRVFSLCNRGRVLCRLGLAAGALFASVILGATSFAGTVTFGSGSNTFSMEFVTIGNPGNAGDTSEFGPSGAVGYTYNIGKFEVSRDMITKYNANFGTANNLSITLDPMTGITGGTGVNKPATGVSWNEAARFVNWLNTSTGGSAAYRFTTGGVNDDIAVWTTSDTLDYDPLNPYRSKRANYVLPSADEWYKAAYYNPSNSTYYDFPNGSDTAPTAVASGTGAGTAVYNQGFEQGPSDVTLAGGLSPYDVMGLGGNVMDWVETSVIPANSNVSFPRGTFGGFWNVNASFMSSSVQYYDLANSKSSTLGFRVASLSSSVPPAVPEPTSMAIFGLGALGMAYRARRKAKAKAKQA